MTLRYIAKLALKICNINIEAKKIDGPIFEMFEIVIASFQIEDKFKKAWFFQETFLLVNISVKVVLRITFLIWSSAIILFEEKKLT